MAKGKKRRVGQEVPGDELNEENNEIVKRTKQQRTMDSTKRI
jgi:hypothetical protein